MGKKPKLTEEERQHTWTNLNQVERDNVIERYAIVDILLKRKIEPTSFEFQGDKVIVRSDIIKKSLEPDLTAEIERLRRLNP